MRPILILCGVATLGLFIATLTLSGQPVTRPATSALGEGDRFLTQLCMDKPIYRTGEKLYVRGVLLRAGDHTPQPVQGQAVVEIKGPKGDTVASGIGSIQDSILGYSWDIPTAQAGGEYTLKVTHPWTGDAPAQRKFDIRAYRAPRLKSEIVFVRDGYGPGASVSASLHVDRAEGGPPVGAKVSASARVDGAEAWKGESTIDAAGNCEVTFKLPAEIARGEGTLALVIEDGGVVETASKTIPILLQTVDLNIYPEGGDLVAGLANRVYIETRTPSLKPADIAGIVVDSAGKQVATFRTEHEGRARFSFMPARGETYALRISEPAGIRKTFPLPAVKASGVVVTSVTGIIARDRNVAVTLAATAPGKYTVTLRQREKEIVTATADLRAGQTADLSLVTPKSVDGVLTLTVTDEKGTPLAERLIFRQPQHALRIKVTSDQSDYTPGDKVTLNVFTTDDTGKPVGALVGLTVTDDSVLEMIEKREQAPRLPAMFFLENDVRELADANVYLDESNPKASLAVDLLLGTQGWRRFALVDPAKFLAASGDAGRRALAVKLITDADKAILTRTSAPVGGAFVFEDEIDVLRARRPFAVPMAAPPAPMAAALPDNAQFKKVGNEAKQKNPALDREEGGLPATQPVFGGRGARGQGRYDFIIFREFAHSLRPNWSAGDRSDFTETLYWSAGVKTDPSTGLAKISFDLNDSVTSFRVTADAFDASGALGSASSTVVESIQPFYVEPKLPLQVTGGDFVQLPIAIVNSMNRQLSGAQISAKPVAGIEISNPAGDLQTLAAKERIRRLMQLEISPAFNGNVPFVLDAAAGPYHDSVSRTLNVQPLGFPYEKSHGGMLEANTTVSHEFVLPGEIVKGSLSTSVTVFPTPLASLTGALERLLQEPNGCFEQTSSTSYPLVMAQQYFLTHQGIDPKIVEKAKGMLDNAYKRLTGFESPKKGYEWFGADPGHEALTAYGLMQFTDMTQVRDVDPQMLQRTRDWLLARRDGNGGFERNARALDSFGGAPPATTDAYVVWALLESGQKGLEKEIAAVKSSAISTDDSYIVALGANVLALSGDAEGAQKLMEKLAAKQQADGSLAGAVTSITRSGGDALTIETTALSMLAWMHQSSFAPNVEKGIRWIAESCKAGRFGSTQSTILALRAIVDYDQSRARPKAGGILVLVVDGKAVGNPIAFTPETQGSLAMPDFTASLTPGKHTVQLKMENGSGMPFAMTVKYFSTLPNSSDQTKVGLSVSLRDQKIDEGDVTEAAVTVTNRTKEAIPTPVAIIGIPGGLEVRHDHLKELVRSGKIDAYEVIGREVVLYWRAIKADTKIELPMSLVAAIPGTYSGPACRAYLYYTDEYKCWTPGLKVTITPRD